MAATCWVCRSQLEDPTPPVGVVIVGGILGDRLAHRTCADNLVAIQRRTWREMCRRALPAGPRTAQDGP